MSIEYFLSYIIFVLIAGLRFRVGGDSLAYENYFVDIPHFNDLSRFDFKSAYYEPLWYVFGSLVKLVHDSFVTFQIFHAILVNAIVFWFIKKYSSNKWLVLIFYFIFYYVYFNMEILRESLAICVFLLSVPFLLKKKWVIYYLICIISFNFHSSAFITFLIPFLLINLKTWQYVCIYILLIIVFFYFSPAELLSGFNITSSLNQKVSTYSAIEVSLWGFLMEIIKLLPILVIFNIRKASNLNQHKLAKLINVYIIIGILSAFIAGFYRFQNYLAIIAIIYIADSFVLFREQKFKLSSSYFKVYAMIFLLFINQIYYYAKDTSNYQIGTRFYNFYFPYHSVFDPQIDNNREQLFFNSMDKD